MNDAGRRAARRLALAVLMGTAVACSSRAATTAPAATLPTNPPSVRPAATATAFATLKPAFLPAPSPSATATAVPVTVAAVKGNLYIRRGPDMGFNPIGVLASGQSATANGRDVLGKWLRIALPGQSDREGWVSIQTIYSAVSGDLQQLPEIMPTYWPVPAFLRNCTFHDMTAQPGGILLPSLLNFPANDVRVNPGIYRVYDNDVDGYPEVLKVELREGSAVDIRDDGDGGHRKCPVP